LKYVTLVSDKEIVLSKSHVVVRVTIGGAILTECGRRIRDPLAEIRELPECRGVCKSCERRKG
jgi:hypothetical protein